MIHLNRPDFLPLSQQFLFKHLWEVIKLNLCTNYFLRQQIWRYFSYSFVHESASHIAVNAAFELLVGLPLEMTQQTFRIVIVFSTGVLAASLGSSCVDPHDFLAGASGGVYALISAHLASLILNWEEDSLILQRRIRSKQIELIERKVV